MSSTVTWPPCWTFRDSPTEKGNPKAPKIPKNFLGDFFILPFTLEKHRSAEHCTQPHGPLCPPWQTPSHPRPPHGYTISASQRKHAESMLKNFAPIRRVQASCCSRDFSLAKLSSPSVCSIGQASRSAVCSSMPASINNLSDIRGKFVRLYHRQRQALKRP